MNTYYQFEEVVKLLKDGSAVRRDSWPQGSFLVLSPGAFKLESEKFFSPILKETASKLVDSKMGICAALMKKNENDEVEYYALTTLDVLASDWLLV